MRLMLPFKQVWEKEPSLINAFGLKNKQAPIISVVGAGGKTSTIEHLAKEYEALGRKVIVTTTTKMFQPNHWTWCREESVEAVDNYLEKETVLWIGLPCGEEKIMSPGQSFLATLKKKGLPMLIEADGARRRPFKLPGDMEPIILEGTHVVIGVLGMNALNKAWKEACFRSERAEEHLHKTENELIIEADYVEVIKSSFGLKKGVSEDMDYIVILNQVDDEEKLTRALIIREKLHAQGLEQIYLTSYR